MSRFIDAQRSLKNEFNMHISVTDGEYRVTFYELQGTRKGEDAAYYTYDLQDAITTAQHMRSLHDLRRKHRHPVKKPVRVDWSVHF